MILDDDMVSLKLLSEYVQRTAGFQLVAAMDNPIAALARLWRSNVDVLILDMEMPELHGMDFLAQIKPLLNGQWRGRAKSLHVIVVSAHRDYAADTYDFDVMDYLKKPVTYERFVQGLQKMWKSKRDASLEGPSEELMLVRVGRELKRVVIRFEEIVYVEAQGMESMLHFDVYNKIVVPKPMGDLLMRLPSKFKRCHRSFAVNVDFVQEIGSQQLYVRDFEEGIPLGDRKLYPDFAFWEQINAFN